MLSLSERVDPSSFFPTHRDIHHTPNIIKLIFFRWEITRAADSRPFDDLAASVSNPAIFLLVFFSADYKNSSRLIRHYGAGERIHLKEKFISSLRSHCECIDIARQDALNISMAAPLVCFLSSIVIKRFWGCRNGSGEKRQTGESNQLFIWKKS